MHARLLLCKELCGEQEAVSMGAFQYAASRPPLVLVASYQGVIRRDDITDNSIVFQYLAKGNFLICNWDDE